MNIDALVRRAEIVRAIRKFFDDMGFVEVETDTVIAAPAPEEHIDCPRLENGAFLRASPELQMKKLLAAGMDRIYQIGPCFREGERGDRHNPEFTMMEWYRRDATYKDIRRDLEGMIRVFRPEMEFATISVREAYRRFAGWDPWEGEWNQDRFDVDMANAIEPGIGEMGGGVFLCDYPPQAASLSLISTVDGISFAERWEFYLDGVELANCFSELCNGDEQTRRFEKSKAARILLGEADYPIDYDFLESVSRIGQAAGVALGIDRLVMALTGEKTISAVRAS